MSDMNSRMEEVKDFLKKNHIKLMGLGKLALIMQWELYKRPNIQSELQKTAQEEITDVEIEFIQDQCMERTEHGVKLDALKFARKVIRASKGEKT